MICIHIKIYIYINIIVLYIYRYTLKEVAKTLIVSKKMCFKLLLIYYY